MTTTHTLRKASKADIPTINSLAEAIWEPSYSAILSQEQIDYMFEAIYTQEALLQQMQEGQTFLLLYEQENPVGFAAYSVKDAREKIYKLNKIYLLPACQGKGLGLVLISEVEKEVRAQGGVFLHLNVNRHNKAKLFYERCGYKVHREEDIPIGPYWMNDYIMCKKL